jgi:hypothetical protein
MSLWDVDDGSLPVLEIRRDFDFPFLELFDVPILTGSTTVKKISVSCILCLFFVGFDSAFH